MNTQLMIAGYCPVGNYSFEIIYKKMYLSICYSRLIILYRKVQY